MSYDEELRESARVAVEDCMDVGAGEDVLVVTDEIRRSIGRAIHDAAVERAESAVYLEIEADERHGAEPPEPVVAAMKASDVVVAPTTRSLTHTRARIDACDAGARVATMPSITEDVMRGAMQADYREVERRAHDLQGRLEDVDELRIESPQGTDLSLEVGDRAWKPDTGVCHTAGCVTNLPAGEVYTAPTDGSGTLVVDGTMSSVGIPDTAIEIEFEDGRAVDVSHDGLRDTVDAAGSCGRNLAEVGVGVNPAATLIGNVLQDEKVAGTVHVAVGDSSGFGGDVECDVHLDGVVKEPRVYADGMEFELPTGDG